MKHATVAKSFINKNVLITMISGSQHRGTIEDIRPNIDERSIGINLNTPSELRIDIDYIESIQLI